MNTIIVTTGDVMIRERHVVTQPSERGRPCVQPLIQHKPCPAVPCYTWHHGPWGSCNLQVRSGASISWKYVCH